MNLRSALFSLFLAGCAVNEDRPVPIPDWRSGHGDFTVPPPAAPIDWTDGLSLAELLRAVERHGRSIAALEEWETARARKVTAGTYQSYPELAFEGAQSVDGESTQAGIGVQQRVELGGRLSKREAVAEAGIARAGAEARDTLRELRSRARLAWWNASIAFRKQDVSRRFAELAAKDVEVAVARYDARQATATDVNSAKVRAAKARAAVKSAEGEVEATRAEVEALAGESPPAGWLLAVTFPADRPEPDLAKALAAARTGRPDLDVLSQASLEAGARATLADAEGAPELGLGLGYEWERGRVEGDGVDIRMNDHMVTFGISLTLPLWNSKRGEVLEAQADRRRFDALRAALETEVGREVTASAARLNAASQTLDLFEKEVLPLASKNLEDVRAAYADGNLGIAELLRAQQDYLDSLGESIEAEAAYASARVDLESAVDQPLSEFAK